jgi:hypothetical protein
MKISSSIVTFRIDIDFEDSNVDVVYNEARANGIQTPVPSLFTDIDDSIKPNAQTPKGDSVDFALCALKGHVDFEEMRTSRYRLNDDTELRRLGIEITETSGLMMGNSFLICEVDAEIYSPELVDKAKKIVFDIFERFVVYYK